VRFADEILVVDSFSTDRTLEIARKYATRVLQHEYENSAAQKNWSIPQAKHDWVLIVDSDERVPPDLAAEIQEIVKAPDFDGYWIRRRNFFLGREIRHGTWKTDKVLRLFRREKARYQPKHVHAEIELQGQAGWCRGCLDHYSYRNLDDFLRKARRYSTWGAMNAGDQGKRASGSQILGHSMAHFFKSYLLKQGFRDGTPGLIIAFMESFHSFLKYAKLWEMQQAPEAKKNPLKR
jgi:glycosyltransferase involved in cell wall biosynthesis